MILYQTDESRLATSMELLFTTWDPVFQSISDSIRTFLTILTEELTKELSDKPNTPATTEDSYLEGIYLWLEHITTSETWKQHKHLLCSITYMRFVCGEWPNHWTNMLAKIVEQEIETSQVNDSLSTQSVLSLDDHVEAPADDLQASGWWY